MSDATYKTVMAICAVGVTVCVVLMLWQDATA